MKVEVERSMYCVIKNKDVTEYLDENEQKSLAQIQSKICEARMSDGKKEINQYWVCNIDEPYSRKVIEIILKGESDKQEIAKCTRL